MKIVLVTLILLPSYCVAQLSWRTGEASAYQVTAPAIGSYAFLSSNLIDWIYHNGGRASALSRGGDFLNIAYSPGVGIIGGSFGGVFSRDKTSSLVLYYADVTTGVKLFTNDLFQLNLLAHVSYVNYRIGDLIPNEFTRPFDKSFTHYTRGWTCGAGPALQIRMKAVEFRRGGFISVGAEAGILFMDPYAHWTFNYQYLTLNNKYHKNRYSLNTSRNPIDGPEVASQLMYLRFSVIINL